MEENGTLVPSKSAILEAGLFLDDFQERNLGKLSDEQRVFFLNRLLSFFLNFQGSGLCVYAFSGSDTTFVKGFTAGTTIYADNNPRALADAKGKRPEIETLEVDLFGGLPKEYDSKVDLLVERNFCGQPTFTLDMFIESITDGGYYLLWGGGKTRHTSDVSISTLQFGEGYFSVSAVFSSVNLEFPLLLKEKVEKILGTPLNPESIFPWIIYRVQR